MCFCDNAPQYVGPCLLTRPLRIAFALYSPSLSFMASAANLCLQIETTLAKRVPAADKTSPRTLRHGDCKGRCRSGRLDSMRERHRGYGRGIDRQNIFGVFVHSRNHAVRRCLRVGRCERCALRRFFTPSHVCFRRASSVLRHTLVSTFSTYRA